MTKKVLITGATGFLGGYVVDEFYRNDYEVVAMGRNVQKLHTLKRKGVTLLAGSLSDLATHSDSIDTVIHVAARSTIWGPWKSFYADNVIGTQHVIDFCHRNNVHRLVFISSPSIYASRSDRLDIPEGEVDKRNHLNNYIRSKIAAEERISQAQKSGLETVILRPRGIIGVGDTSIVPRIVHTNSTFGIPLFKGGSNLIDLTCVENVAHATRLAAESPLAAGNVYNITNGEPREFKSIVDDLFTSIHVTPRYKRRNIGQLYFLANIVECAYRILRLRGEPPLTRYTVSTIGYSQTLDISRARNDLGYKPIISIKKGIQQYAKAYRQSNRKS